MPDEIVIVDQSTSDATREFAAARPSASVNYVKDEGAGLGRAQNIAFASASGELVAVLDDDCVAEAGWLEAIAGAFSSGYDFVSGPVLPLASDDDSLLPVSSRTSREPAELGRRTLPWDAGSGNNFAVRREAFLAIGGCDERLGPGSKGLGGVDMDLFHRLLRTGLRGRYEPTALVYHERKTRQERLDRRYPYGFGVGACCTLLRRAGDRRASRVFGAWLALRLEVATRSAVRLRLGGVREEALVLWGTLRGIQYGLRLPEPDWEQREKTHGGG